MAPKKPASSAAAAESTSEAPPPSSSVSAPSPPAPEPAPPAPTPEEPGVPAPAVTPYTPTHTSQTVPAPPDLASAMSAAKAADGFLAAHYQKNPAQSAVAETRKDAARLIASLDALFRLFGFHHAEG